jgi:hypothetical protein
LSSYKKSVCSTVITYRYMYRLSCLWD